LQNLGMSHIAAKFVPCLLTDGQKQIWVNVSRDLLNRANEDENFLKKRLKGRHDRKKRDKCSQTLKSFWEVFFSILRALFTMNFFHKARQSQQCCYLSARLSLKTYKIHGQM
jgi:hypothetical protein